MQKRDGHCRVGDTCTLYLGDARADAVVWARGGGEAAPPSALAMGPARPPCTPLTPRRKQSTARCTPATRIPPHVHPPSPLPSFPPRPLTTPAHSGNADDYRRVLWESSGGRLTPEIMASWPKPLKAWPHHLPHLIEPFKHYLWILKVRQGAAAGWARWGWEAAGQRGAVRGCDCGIELGRASGDGVCVSIMWVMRPALARRAVCLSLLPSPSSDPLPALPMPLLPLTSPSPPLTSPSLPAHLPLTSPLPPPHLPLLPLLSLTCPSHPPPLPHLPLPAPAPLPLQTTHSGADLDTAMEMAKGHMDDDLRWCGRGPGGRWGGREGGRRGGEGGGGEGAGRRGRGGTKRRWGLGAAAWVRRRVRFVEGARGLEFVWTCCAQAGQMGGPRVRV